MLGLKMSRFQFGRGFIAACMLSGLSTAALADEPVASRFAKGDVVASGSLDYLNLSGVQDVYYAPGDKRLFSEQTWKTSSAIGLTGKLRIGTTDRTSLYAAGTFGFFANSKATTTSWTARDAFGFDDWTDHSEHPDTALDHYYDLDVGAQVNLLQNDTGNIGVLGGFHYTDVQWTASGGSGVSSDPFVVCSPVPDCLLRNTITFYPDGQKLITNQQKLPAIYAGLTGGVESGNWSFDGALKVGATLGAQTVNHYWIPERKFVSDFKPGLYLGVAANVGYKVKDNIKLNLGVSYDRVGMSKGNVKAYSLASGSLLSETPDTAGASLDALKVSLGASVKF
jgi:omptin